MLWIKRNLFFVIGIAVGVLLIGGAGYYLWNALNDNSSASDDLKGALSEWQTLQTKSPYPSSENILAAQDEQKRLRAFLGEFRQSFAPFPAPAKTDEKGFKTYLEKTLAVLQMAATNARVQL